MAFLPSLVEVLTNPSLVAMAALATLTVHLAVWRASILEKSLRLSSRNGGVLPSNAREATGDETPTLSPAQSIALIPLFAAIMIIFLFFFIDRIGSVLILLAASIAVVSVPYTFHPLVARCLTGRAKRVFLCSLAIVIVLLWLLSGSLVLNNAIAISMAILITSFVRVDSLKMLTILMMGLVVYDVVFVFVSPYMFSGRNVMLDVATAEPRNPLDIVAEALNFGEGAVKSLSFPGKLVLPLGGSDSLCVLGLGDVLIPAIFCSFLQRADSASRLRFSHRTKYYFLSLPVVFSSVLLSYLFNVLYETAQPALLYIVPALLATTLTYAHAASDLAWLWCGDVDSVQPSDDEAIQELLLKREPSCET